jgi:hypothetical protein
MMGGAGAGEVPPQRNGLEWVAMFENAFAMRCSELLGLGDTL